MDEKSMPECSASRRAATRLCTPTRIGSGTLCAGAGRGVIWKGGGRGLRKDGSGVSRRVDAGVSCSAEACQACAGV